MRKPEQLEAELAAVGLTATADRPPVPGAYLLLLDLDRAVALDMPRLAGAEIVPGWYVYAGSANGPGGLKARIARHLRRDKSLHWHIDRLTAHAEVTALAVPGGSECDLVMKLVARPGFSIPLSGFGSSDCRRCASHLLRWAG